MRKRIRRQEIAKNFGIHVRTVDKWVRLKIFPPPHYLPGSPIPFWFADEIDKRLKSKKAA